MRWLCGRRWTHPCLRLVGFEVEINPADRLPSLAQYSKARDRALTLAELKAFWKRVESASAGAAKDALVTCFLLGGQLDPMPHCSVLSGVARCERKRSASLWRESGTQCETRGNWSAGCSRCGIYGE